MRFQRLSIVRLCSPDVVPPDSPDDERIQSEHIAYLTSLRDKGIIVLNGPVRFEDSPRFRGMSIYTVDVEDARGSRWKTLPSKPVGSRSWWIAGGCQAFRLLWETVWTSNRAPFEFLTIPDLEDDQRDAL